MSINLLNRKIMLKFGYEKTVIEIRVTDREMSENSPTYLYKIFVALTYLFTMVNAPSCFVTIVNASTISTL